MTSDQYCVNRRVFSMVVEMFGLVYQYIQLQAKRVGVAHKKCELLSTWKFQIDVKITSKNNRYFIETTSFNNVAFRTILYIA